MATLDRSEVIDGCTVKVYTTLHCVMSWRCGYVTFPENDNPIVPGVDYQSVADAPVNGGITYQEGRTLGWDYAHVFNVRAEATLPSDETVFEEAKRLIAWMRKPQ